MTSYIHSERDLHEKDLVEICIEFTARNKINLYTFVYHRSTTTDIKSLAVS